MRSFLSSLCLLSALVSATPVAEPLSEHELRARRLLGSSFGAPGDATFDYVIVGGGTAGLAMAYRLAEDPNNLVAVVEAGSFYEIGNSNHSQLISDGVWFAGRDPNDINPLIDWGFLTTPQAGFLNATSHYTTGKTLGGGSARNYMAYHPATKGTHKKWADQVGDDSYLWDRFLPYLKKSQNFTAPNPRVRGLNASVTYDPSVLSTSRGPLSVTFGNYDLPFSTWVEKALVEIGINPLNGFNSGYLNGSAYQLLTIDPTEFTRVSSEVAFLRPALERPNYIVYQSTMAQKILFDSSKTATGVLVSMGKRRFTLKARKEVIVTAGVFQSPHLLMVSGVGPAAKLRRFNIPVVADRPGVGQNMWDHILGGPSYRVGVTTFSALGNPAFAAAAAEEFNTRHTGILTNTAADLLAFEKVPNHLRANFSAATRAALATFPADWPEIEHLITSAYFGNQQNFITGGPTDAYQYVTISFALVAPLSRGYVDIMSANMEDPPLINPNWLTHPADQEVAIAGYKRVRELFATDALKPILIGPEYFPAPELGIDSDAEILDFIRKSFNTVFHAGSTCAMGRSEDPRAVVDSRAKVFGVQKLRVVDASALPFMIPGHPMATIYALAEKIADDIKAGR